MQLEQKKKNKTLQNFTKQTTQECMFVENYLHQYKKGGDV
jgi:hypothetical protein